MGFKTFSLNQQNWQLLVIFRQVEFVLDEWFSIMKFCVNTVALGDVYGYHRYSSNICMYTSFLERQGLPYAC